MVNLKYKILSLLVFTPILLFSNQIQFSQFIEEILQNDVEFQMKKNKLNIEKAKAKIKNSTNWFDVNFEYNKKNNSKIRREEINDTIDKDDEFSDIIEDDEEYGIELSKTFFEQDSKSIFDKLNFKINILSLKQEIELYKIERSAEIINDFILWKKAILQIEILEDELALLKRENKILEKLDKENIVQIQDLIANLEEISKCEDEIEKWKNEIEKKKIAYEDFHKFEIFQKLTENKLDFCDTTSFQKILSQKYLDYEKRMKKILFEVKLKKYLSFLPEIEISFSLRERNLVQNWDIEEVEKNAKDTTYYSRERTISEVYPAGKIELSLPFNIVGNSIGKYRYLKALERQTRFSSYKMKAYFQN
ncbi:MAG: hypothetical protein ISS38_03255, partial [Candidatus Cloacimonetes bacterium]|nr:hypothetical protein [Candidatus Cloacimonadota bacterium]